MSDYKDVELNLLYETPAHTAPIQITTPKSSENQSHGKPSNSVNDLANADAVSLFKTIIDSQLPLFQRNFFQSEKLAPNRWQRK